MCMETYARDNIRQIFHHREAFTPAHFCRLANQQYILELRNFFSPECKTCVIRETFHSCKFQRIRYTYN